MKSGSSADATKQEEQPYGWLVWLAGLFSVVLVFSILLTFWAVRHALEGGSRLSAGQAALVVSIAEFPVTVRTAVQELRSALLGEPLPLLMNRSSVEQPGWIRKFPAAEDSGYLLFSGVDPLAKQAVVELIKISDGTVAARWVPDWLAIMAQTTSKQYAPLGSQYAAKAVHPLLLADGDIIFGHNGGSLVRMSTCSSKPVWVLDEAMHHSVELDEAGTGIWSPSVAQDGFSDNPWLQARVRDDALGHVSLDGRLIEQLSFVRILRENGLQALLMGTSGGKLKEDPIHLNEIKVARQDSRYWKRGDLLISSRHLSTLFLYRPATRKIIWYQTGPWMNQHSADFLDDHRISVFDNHVVGGPTDVKAHIFANYNDINQVFVYDFDNRQLTQPFKALLAQARPVTITAGRARLLPDGGLFVEETNYGRHLRFSKDRLIWSRVNDYDDHRIGAVSWSRYLTAEEVSLPLKAISARQCQTLK